MTQPDDATQPDRPDWDTTVLDHPTVISVPAKLPDRPDPIVVGAAEAVAARRAGDQTRANLWLERLAHAGVVAIRTNTTTLEIRETLDGWTLVGTHPEPDPAALGAQARQRARRLAADRRRPRTSPNGDGPGAATSGRQ